eukprot:CAMPEP_0198273936 /NCGR_PEP_ID=MMETSP1447-20131203/58485_1 /TAXON_ID=420782 /ORGANISM="Chaetoceros dichaeta, Strain CCMP1751" /LENGTH=390 /DNA_ID=CAMNT_0043967829 /DNA_START=11 /DNA_END=1183 /DNA_ORIENTATION=+
MSNMKCFPTTNTQRTSTSRSISTNSNKVLILAVVVIIVHTLTHLPLPSDGLVLNRIEKVLFQKRINTIRRSIEQKQQQVQPSDRNGNAQQTKLLFPISTSISDVSTNKNDKSILDRQRRREVALGIDINIVIIFPGAGGPDQFTKELESKINTITSTTTNAEHNDDAIDHAAGKRTTTTIVHTFDWSEYRGSQITAAFDSEVVGEALAHSLWKEKNEMQSQLGADDDEGAGISLTSVHSIGISVGAFASQAFAATICQLRNTDTNTDMVDAPQKENNELQYVRLTLLDPFCSRGIWGLNYGATHFGTGGIDYAEQYLNTDDPVPTTNDPLPLCACVDVTGVLERESFVLPEGETMHCWPLVYFARYGYRDSAFLYHGVDGVRERGSVDRR